MNYNRLFFLLLISALLSSCVTSKTLTYLQSQIAHPDTTMAVQPENYKIQPFDNLFIRVITPDPQWSVMFNTLQSSSSTGTVSEQSADLISYTVDSEGYIDLPYEGNFKVSGKTIRTVKAELEPVLKGYVTDAALTVKMINNYISVLGEVRSPGRYLIYKDRMNIFQALAMAGDLSDFSNRQRIQIIRQLPGGSVTKEFSLLDRKVLSSEFFYVLPNDVIYAKPIEGVFFKMNAFPYGVIISTITTFILFLNIVR